MTDPTSTPNPGASTVVVNLPDGRPVEVRRPRIPPKARLGRYQRRVLAAEWLRRLGQGDDAARVELVAPFVGRFHPNSPLGRAADHLVAHNQLPTREAVEREYLRRLARRRLAEQEAAAVDDDVVLTFIADQWRLHGHGPTWRAIADHADIAQRTLQPVMRRLASQGKVAYTKEAGSTRVVAPEP